jgi:DtxR family Mn-dependent transcriptional regulator
MDNPVAVLLVAGTVLLMVALLWWPKTGIIAKRKKSKETAKKELMEDALKCIYDNAKENLSFTFDNLVETLSVDHTEVRSIVNRLQELKLLKSKGQLLNLTSEGIDYALRIIRIHRLWERYLSEETGIPETAWHAQAEIQEHKLSEEEANKLSHQMGHPRYDPHGDPIPTRSGDLPPEKGRALIEFSEGDIVQVIHIEDEPVSVYAEIIDKGIHLDNQVEILKKLKSKLHILTDGHVYTFSFDVAKNITVVLSAKEEAVEEPFLSLTSLKMGEKAKVIKISRACRGTQRRRLMDLGIVPGTIISMALVSAGGDPKAYNIRGAVIALRKDQAAYVNVKPLSKVA